MINWKKEAIDELKNYEDLKESIHSLNERIALTQNQIYNISACQIGERVGNSSGNGDDVRLNKMVELEELKARKLITQKRVQLVQNALDKLNNEQRRILELFYIKRPNAYMDELMQSFSIEQAEVYRRKNDALRRFTELMYGILG